MLEWILIAIPATFVNSMIKFFESKLALAFRSRLSAYAYEKYMKDETYYRVMNLDSRISNADQCLTEDVKLFCQNLAHSKQTSPFKIFLLFLPSHVFFFLQVHSQLSKPILDVALNTYQLAALARHRGHGSGLPSGIVAVGAVWVSGKILKFFQPPFGKLVAEQASLEGNLRFVFSRLIQNSEEVAFYRGHTIEESILSQSYDALAKHMAHICDVKIFYTMLEGFLLKYGWSTAGMLMLALPAFLSEGWHGTSEGVSVDVISTRTGDYVTSKKLLTDGADAIERIMLALKDIAELGGYTNRVCEMLDVFEQVQRGEYVKQSVTEEEEENIDDPDAPTEKKPKKEKVDIRLSRGVILFQIFKLTFCDYSDFWL